MGVSEDILTACEKAAGWAKVLEPIVPRVDYGSLGTRSIHIFLVPLLVEFHKSSLTDNR